MGGASEKICVICGQDCSSKPRIKDAHGHYACKACAAAKMGAGTATAPVPVLDPEPVELDPLMPVDDDLGLDAFLDADGPDLGPVEGAACPACGSAMSPDQVICLNCGADARSGKKRKTKVLKADKEPKERSGGVTIDSTAYVFGFAVLAAIALPIVAAVSQEAAVAAMAIGGIWYLVAFVMMIIGAFKDGDTVWGVAGICLLIPGVGGLIWAGFTFYYCIFGSERTAWKYNYWLATLSQLTLYLVVITQYTQMFGQSGGFGP